MFKFSHTLKQVIPCHDVKARESRDVIKNKCLIKLFAIHVKYEMFSILKKGLVVSYKTY